MVRITKDDLDHLCAIIAKRTGDDGYFIEYTAGRPRLFLGVGDLTVKASGRVREVSPRLTARELSYWMDGFIEGIDVGEREEASENPQRGTVHYELLQFGQEVIDERGDKPLWITGDLIASGDEEDLPDTSTLWEEVSIREAQEALR